MWRICNISNRGCSVFIRYPDLQKWVILGAAKGNHCWFAFEWCGVSIAQCLLNVVWWSQLSTRPKTTEKRGEVLIFVGGEGWMKNGVKCLIHLFKWWSWLNVKDSFAFSAKCNWIWEAWEEMWERHGQPGEVRICEVQYLTTYQFLEISQFYPHNDSY